MYAEVIVAHDGSALASSALGTGRQLGAAWDCPVHVVHVSAGADTPDLDTEDLPTEIIHADDVPSTLVEVQGSRQALLCLASRGRSVLGTALFGSVTVDLLRRTHEPIVLTGPGLDPSDTPSAPARALVCLDGSSTSESIVPIARQWARELGLHLTFLHVAYPPGERGMDAAGGIDDNTAAAIDQVVHHGRGTVDEGLDASWAVVRHTSPAIAILAEAQHHRADLILMATHGRSALERMLVGSVTNEVLRQSPLPVVVCRPHGLA